MLLNSLFDRISIKDLEECRNRYRREIVETMNSQFLRSNKLMQQYGSK